MENRVNNILVVIGNGFDISCGLNTRYSDFIHSISNHGDLFHNYIYLHLKRQLGINNWVDAEQELATCANNLINTDLSLLTHKYRDISITASNKKDYYNQFKDSFKDDYIQIKQKLKAYIQGQISGWNLNSISQNRNSAMQLTRSLLVHFNNNPDINITILNFNYTTTFFNMLEIANNFHSEHLHSNFKHLHVHGNSSSNIVFGIDDKEIVDKADVYLHKSFDLTNINNNVNVSKLLMDSNKIIFYGYSLGKTDSSYFDDFFRYITKFNADDSLREITFYYYKESGYIDLFDRLLDLTEHNTAKLKQYNKIEFIDSSK